MKRLAVCVWMVASLGITLAVDASQAAAQAAPAVGVSGAPAIAATAQPIRDDSETFRDRTPMDSAAIGLRVGMAGVGAAKGSVESMGYTLEGDMGSRRGLHLALPIHLGGSGFGWTFEPYLSRSSVRHTLKNDTGAVVGSEAVPLLALGMYMGPTVTFHPASALYVGFGLGIKGAYIMNDAFDLALDAYGRVPLTFTYYLADELAIVAETGLGYGGSMFVDKPQLVVDPINQTLGNVRDDPQFGLAFAWDCSIGVRLP